MTYTNINPSAPHVKLKGFWNPTTNTPIIADSDTAASVSIGSFVVSAKKVGSTGNIITFKLVAGGTAGAEVATVVGTAIEVEIEDGVSTQDQVGQAIDAVTAITNIVSYVAGTPAGAMTASTNTLAGGCLGGKEGDQYIISETATRDLGSASIIWPVQGLALYSNNKWNPISHEPPVA